MECQWGDDDDLPELKSGGDAVFAELGWIVFVMGADPLVPSMESEAILFEIS
jgi:hypothetical protein